MNYGDIFIYFGWGVIFVSIAAVFIPFLFFKQHLMTFRNALIGGCIPFVGSSSIALMNGSQEPYSAYINDDYKTFVFIFVSFFVTFIVAYQLYKPPKITTKLFVNRPTDAESLPILFAIVALVFGVTNLSIAQGLSIPVISQIIVRVGPTTSAFAAIFAIGSWIRDRTNPIKLSLMIFVLGFSLVLAVMSGGGRRNFLGVLVTLPLLFYWESLVNVSRVKTTVLIVVAGMIAFVVMSAYNEVRHFDRGRNALADKRDFEHSLDAIKKIPKQMMNISETLESRQFHNELGQNATNASMYVVSKSRKGGASSRVLSEPFPQYFHSLIFVAVNPIPRKYWEDKPESLGAMLPKDYNPYFKMNWGSGIVGHSVYEGGLFMAVFYGIFFAVLLKTFDVSLENNRSDLFLLGLFAAGIPHVIMLVRGDLGIVLLNCIFVLIFYLVTKFIAMRLYGSAPSYAVMHKP